MGGRSMNTKIELGDGESVILVDGKWSHMFADPSLEFLSGRMLAGEVLDLLKNRAKTRPELTDDIKKHFPMDGFHN